jgi:hypothetical protein
VTPVGPDATRAVVLGIDAYQAGAEWTLDRCVQDAARVATWLLDVGVLPDRLTCLFAPAADSAAALAAVQHLEQRGAAVRGDASRNAVETLFRELAGTQEELLLVFWSGHGVLLDEEDDRALLTSDATSQWLFNVRVNELLRFLRQSDTGPFARQLLLFDACANFIEQLSGDRRPPTSTWPSSTRYEVDQFVLFSAAQGQIAATTRTQFEGFADAALTYLRQRGWPPDGPGLAGHVEDHFALLRDRGRTRQTPVTLWRGGSGSGRRRTFGGGPVGAHALRASAAARLTVAQIRRLADVLDEWPLLESATGRDALATTLTTLLPDAAQPDAVSTGTDDALAMLADVLLTAPAGPDSRGVIDPLLQAMEQLGTTDQDRTARLKVEDQWQRQQRVAPVLDAIAEVGADQLRRAFYIAVPDRQLAPSPAELDNALEYLASLPPVQPPWRHPLLIFVARLERAAQVMVDDGWFGLSPGNLQRLRAEAATDPADQWAHLVINASPGILGNPVRFVGLTGHLSRDDGQWDMRHVPCGDSPEEMERATRELLDWAHRLEERDLTLGFLLPRERFDLVPERWCYSDGFSDPSPVEDAYPVVLHCGDRFRSPRPMQSWQQRVKEIRRQLKDFPPAVAWPAAGDLRSVPAIRKLIDATTCFGLRDKEFLTSLLRWGAPYVIWYESQPDDLTVVTKVAKLMVAGGFEDLPVRWYQAADTDPAQPPAAGEQLAPAHVRLVWDSPTWLPPVKEEE